MMTRAINSATDYSRWVLKATGCFFPKVAALGLLTPSPGDGDGMQGGVPRSTFCRGLGCFSFFLWVSLSSLPPLCGTGKAAAPRDSPAREPLGWEHTKSLPVCASMSFPAFQQVFGAELAGSRVPAAPGLCRAAGCGGGGLHPEIAFSRVCVASAAWADGRWERGLWLSLQAATNLRLCRKPSAIACSWFPSTLPKPFVALLLNALNHRLCLGSSHELPLHDRIAFSCYLSVTFPRLTCRYSPHTHTKSVLLPLKGKFPKTWVSSGSHCPAREPTYGQTRNSF